MKNKILFVTTFPVNNLFAVHVDNGKQFKSKIHAITQVVLDDYSAIFKAITTLDIREGSIYDIEDFGLISDGNFVGILDENDDWVELDKSKYIKK